MISFPERIKIGAHWFRIEYPYEFAERGDIDGHCCCSLGIIRIGSRTSGGKEHISSFTRKVFFHELIHAIDNIFCGDVLESIQDSEVVINGFAQGFLQVFTDNIEGLSELFQEEEKEK